MQLNLKADLLSTAGGKSAAAGGCRVYMTSTMALGKLDFWRSGVVLDFSRPKTHPIHLRDEHDG